MHALFVICPRVTTLQSYNLRMHLFSANQKCVIFQIHYYPYIQHDQKPKVSPTKFKFY